MQTKLKIHGVWQKMQRKIFDRRKKAPVAPNKMCAHFSFSIFNTCNVALLVLTYKHVHTPMPTPIHRHCKLSIAIAIATFRQ